MKHVHYFRFDLGYSNFEVLQLLEKQECMRIPDTFPSAIGAIAKQ